MLTPQRTPYSRCSHLPQGYSLTELAVVLAILGLVAAGSLSTGKMMLDISEVQGTRERLETVRAALLLFQKKYERYPCPALPADSPASATYGHEVTGSCVVSCPPGLMCGANAVIGAVPFKTLRVNEGIAYDSWDSKITYIVDKNHTEISTDTVGSIPIRDASGNDITASPLLGDAIFVLVSHGQDRKGAYLNAGTLAQACGGAGADVENCNGDDVFVDSRFNMGDIPANYYDDLVLWQTQQNREKKEDLSWFLANDDTHTCAVKHDGTVWCWGFGWHGEIGDGTQTETQPLPRRALGLTGVTSVGTGYYHTCAVRNDGTAWCWGQEQYEHGQVGNGTLLGQFSPVQVPGFNYKLIEAGDEHSCAVKHDGTVWCWGNNAHGQLGDGTTTQRLTPVQVSGLSNAIQVTGGHQYSCAVKSDGTVWCWGYNIQYMLGDGTLTEKLLPVQVSGLSGAIQVDAMYETTCAVKNNGTVWCWGWGYDGQLGNGATGNTADNTTPGQVLGLTGIMHVSAGAFHSCAVKSDGTAWCWGNNDHGQLGTSGGSTTMPVQVPGLTNVATIDAAQYFTCAMKHDRTVSCWGGNDYGYLGDGTTTASPTPVQVQNFP